MGNQHFKMRLRCKVALVGDAMVGKTALCAMFGSPGASEFRKNYQMVLEKPLPSTIVLSHRPVHVCDRQSALKLVFKKL